MSKALKTSKKSCSQTPLCMMSVRIGLILLAIGVVMFLIGIIVSVLQFDDFALFIADWMSVLFWFGIGLLVFGGVVLWYGRITMKNGK